MKNQWSLFRHRDLSIFSFVFVVFLKNTFYRINIFAEVFSSKFLFNKSFGYQKLYNRFFRLFQSNYFTISLILSNSISYFVTISLIVFFTKKQIFHQKLFKKLFQIFQEKKQKVILLGKYQKYSTKFPQIFGYHKKFKLCFFQKLKIAIIYQQKNIHFGNLYSKLS